MTASWPLQVETASCIENMAEIAAVPGVDILFLGQNDLCMSMGLYEKYEFPHMYTSPELGAATQKLVENARRRTISSWDSSLRYGPWVNFWRKASRSSVLVMTCTTC